MTTPDPHSAWTEEELNRALQDLEPPTGDDATVLAQVRAEMLAALTAPGSTLDPVPGPATADPPARTGGIRRWWPALAAAACVVAIAATTIVVTRTRQDDGVTSPVLPVETTSTTTPGETSPSDTSPAQTTAVDNPVAESTWALTVVHGGTGIVPEPTEFASWTVPGVPARDSFVDGTLVVKDHCVVLKSGDNYLLPILPESVGESSSASLRTTWSSEGLLYSGSKGWIDQDVTLWTVPWPHDPADVPADNTPLIPLICAQYQRVLVGSMVRAPEPTVTNRRNELEGRTFALVGTYTDVSTDTPSERGLEFHITFGADSATAETLLNGKSCGVIVYPKITLEPDAQKPLKLGEPEGDWCSIGHEPAGPPAGDLMYILDGDTLDIGTGYIGWTFQEQ